MGSFRDFLKFAGKSANKVIAVFGRAPEECDRAVRHVRAGAPGVPVWLFSTRRPLPGTADLCERVFVEPDSMALLVLAQKELWPRWVALGVATWTGEPGGWPLKLAPFLVPPFRALLMTRGGDFFEGKPRLVWRHARRRLRDGLHSGSHRARDIHRGLWLWFFALVAQRFAFLSRWAFRRWHGREPLELVVAPSSGDAVVRFHYAHRQWNWQEVERLARTSAARWILFLEGGAEGDLEPLDGAFAVTRQMAYRGWRRELFPMAPFRRLEPEEISRVLAPVSRAMLVDRAMLAALGVPKTVVPGTAWLLLFWKAAAAGLPSYSRGADRPLAELPDWPYEEAELVTRLLADPGLRRLGPREPELARGSIATRLPAPGRRSGTLSVLVVSPYLPYPLSHGGAVRIYNLCRALSGEVDFLLACFRERNDRTDYDRLYEVFREVYVIDADERAARDPALPRQVREHQSRSLHALIAATRSDLLQVEYTHLAHFRDRRPSILVEHDLTFTLYRQYGDRREAARWLEFERRRLRDYDAVWTMSEDDRAAAVAEGSPAERNWVVPNGVDVERFVPAEAGSSPPEVFYIGSFRHKPNVMGFEELRGEIMPRVWAAYPQARLRVVAGPEPERYWTPGALDSRIELHAFVADVRPFYARAAVVAVPLAVSAGTNIKVLEAMACGKAVVTTPVGCQGLELSDGRDALIRAGAAAFAAAIVHLLAHPGERAALGAAARRTAESRFSWQAIAGRAYHCYRALAAKEPLSRKS